MVNPKYWTSTGLTVGFALYLWSCTAVEYILQETLRVFLYGIPSVLAVFLTSEFSQLMAYLCAIYAPDGQ